LKRRKTSLATLVKTPKNKFSQPWLKRQKTSLATLVETPKNKFGNLG
jgi:hypothetical protein